MQEYQSGGEYQPVYEPHEIMRRRREKKWPWFGGAAMTDKNVEKQSETLLKCIEIVKTGTLRRIKELRQDKMVLAISELASVWDIGKKVAHDLFREGYRSLHDLRYGVDAERARQYGLKAPLPSAIRPDRAGKCRLTRAQLLGLQHHEHLKERVPREEIAQAVDQAREAVLSLLPAHLCDGLKIEGVGSYRRGKLHSGDIDILISHEDGRTHHADEDGNELVPRLVSVLKDKMGMVIDVLKVRC